MGSQQSRTSREHEYDRLERERENVQHAREEQHKEALRLEREKANLAAEAKLQNALFKEREKFLVREREDIAKAIEVKAKLQALRKPNCETQNQLYPNLNISESSRNEVALQATAAPNLVVRNDHFSFQPSAPPAPLAPTEYHPSETHVQMSYPRSYKPTVEIATDPLGLLFLGTTTKTVRTLVSAAQNATNCASVKAPQTANTRISVKAPQKPTNLTSVSKPETAATSESVKTPQKTTNRTSVITPQTAIIRESVTAPQKVTARESVTAPQRATVRESVTEPQQTLNCATASTPNSATVPEKAFARKDDSKSCKSCKIPFEANTQIYQCENEHSVCEICSLKVSCGECWGRITTRRNFGLEGFIKSQSKVKCPNAADGCRLYIKKSELTKHEKECLFKELKCPALEDCNWKGKSSQLSNHFDNEHASSRQASIDTEMFLSKSNISNEHNSLQLIKMGVYNFLFYVKVSQIESKIYMTVYLIGAKESASKWSYEIHIYNKREPHRKYLYVDRVHSTYDTPVFYSDGNSLRDCAVLSRAYAMSFVNKGNLTYKLFIKKNMTPN